MEKTQNFKNTVFACYRGYITQGIVNNLSPLFFVLFQNKFGISYSLISAACPASQGLKTPARVR